MCKEQITAGDSRGWYRGDCVLSGYSAHFSHLPALQSPISKCFLMPGLLPSRDQARVEGGSQGWGNRDMPGMSVWQQQGSTT